MHWNRALIGAYTELEELSSIVDKNSENNNAAYDFNKFGTNKETDKLLAEVVCI